VEVVAALVAAAGAAALVALPDFPPVAEVEVALAAGLGAVLAAGVAAGELVAAGAEPVDPAVADWSEAADWFEVVDWAGAVPAEVGEDDPADWLVFAALAGEEAVVVAPAAPVPAELLAAWVAGAAAAMPTEPPSTAVRAVANAPAEATDRLAIRRRGGRCTTGSSAAWIWSSAALVTRRPARMPACTRWRTRRDHVWSTRPLLLTPTNFLLKVQ